MRCYKNINAVFHCFWIDYQLQEEQYCKSWPFKSLQWTQCNRGNFLKQTLYLLNHLTNLALLYHSWTSRTTLPGPTKLNCASTTDKLIKQADSHLVVWSFRIHLETFQILCTITRFTWIKRKWDRGGLGCECESRPRVGLSPPTTCQYPSILGVAWPLKMDTLARNLLTFRVTLQEKFYERYEIHCQTLKKVLLLKYTELVPWEVER